MLIKLKFVTSNKIVKRRLTLLGKFSENRGMCTINYRVLTRPHRNYRLAELYFIILNLRTYRKTLESMTVETTVLATDFTYSFDSWSLCDNAISLR